MSMVIFAVVFGELARIPSDGLPYPIFAYAALLPWSYFSQAVSRSGVSLVSDSNLIRKIYFSRLIIPIDAVISPVVDFALAFLVLLGMLAWYGIAPIWAAATSPLFLCLALCTALSMGLLLWALNVRYGDVGHAIPVLIELWMYASPVVYPISLIPREWRPIYPIYARPPRKPAAHTFGSSSV